MHLQFWNFDYLADFQMNKCQDVTLGVLVTTSDEFKFIWNKNSNTRFSFSNSKIDFRIYDVFEKNVNCLQWNNSVCSVYLLVKIIENQ